MPAEAQAVAHRTEEATRGKQSLVDQGRPDDRLVSIVVPSAHRRGRLSSIRGEISVLDAVDQHDAGTNASSSARQPGSHAIGCDAPTPMSGDRRPRTRPMASRWAHGTDRSEIGVSEPAQRERRTDGSDEQFELEGGLRARPAHVEQRQAPQVAVGVRTRRDPILSARRRRHRR